MFVAKCHRACWGSVLPMSYEFIVSSAKWSSISCGPPDCPVGPNDATWRMFWSATGGSCLKSLNTEVDCLMKSLLILHVFCVELLGTRHWNFVYYYTLTFVKCEAMVLATYAESFIIFCQFCLTLCTQINLHCPFQAGQFFLGNCFIAYLNMTVFLQYALHTRDQKLLMLSLYCLLSVIFLQHLLSVKSLIPQTAFTKENCFLWALNCFGMMGFPLSYCHLMFG